MNLSRLLPTLALWALVGSVLSTPPVAAAGPPCATAEDALIERLTREGDLAAPALVREVAKLGTPEALEALVEVYRRPHTRHPFRRVMLQALPLGAGEDDYDDAAAEFLDGRVKAGRKNREDEAAVELAVDAARALGEFGMACVPPLADALAQADLLPAREAAFEGLCDSGAPIAKSVAQHVLLSAPAPGGFQRIAGASKAMDARAAELLAADFDQEQLGELLEHRSNSLLRAVALRELSARERPQALERARVALAASWDVVGFDERLAAVEVLLAQGGEEDWEAVLRAGLEQGDGGRRGPGDGFGERVAAALAADPKPELSNLGADLLRSQEDEALGYLVRALCTLDTKDASRIVQQAERSDSPLLRLALVDALARAGDLAALLELAGRSKWEPEERAAALERASLLAPDDPAVVEEALGFVKLRHRGELRGAALRVLGRAGHGDLAPFEEALAEDHPIERLSALEALRELRTPAAVDLLMAAVEDPDPRVSTRVSELLLELTGQSFGQNTDAWVRWGADRSADWAPIDAEHAAYLTRVFASREGGGTQAAEFFGLRIESQRVVFVVDTSGSMQQPMRYGAGSDPTDRLDVVKAELTRALSALPESARFTVVTFSTTARGFHKELVLATPQNVAVAIKKIAKLNADGGTNLFAGLVEMMQANELDTIVLLSDGSPTAGLFQRSADIERVVGNLCRQRGVRLNAIAIGAQQSLLQRLAEATGGEYRNLR